MSSNADLAVRAARAEIERDDARRRADIAERALNAMMTKDAEAMLDTLHILGMPARSLADIYEVVNRWRAVGGREEWLRGIRQHAEAATDALLRGGDHNEAMANARYHLRHVLADLAVQKERL